MKLTPLLLSLLSLPALAFHSHIQPIPPAVKKTMRQYTWHPGCPGLDQLAYVQLSYWGDDNQTHQGTLIVNKELAAEVVTLFKHLYQQHFPIHSMLPMDAFKGDDNASMAANNTSAFNCRDVTNKPGEFSQHSYGRAIDINPLINPYVTPDKVLPTAGRKFTNRKQTYPGKIIKNDATYRLFIQKGWDWGGLWYDVQDFQHVEKRAHGAKRNPYGN